MPCFNLFISPFYRDAGETLQASRANWLASSEISEKLMLEFTYFFFALAVIAAVLGFFGLVGLAALTAKGLCVAFIILFIIATIGRHPRI